VLEHVADLESAAREMYRITKPGGMTIHLYPAHHRLVEGHLHMPLVHWLPKSGTRRQMIRLYTLLGVEPHWKELSSMPVREKADRYFDYSINKTFYRAPREVRRIFDDVGFESTFESHKHDRVVRAGLHKVVPKPLLGWLLNSFSGCVLVARKPALQSEARSADTRLSA
jgi:ubiquinone/menaquinone biosynthesis C-methylase UbiE